MRTYFSCILFFLLLTTNAQQKWMQFNTSNSNLPVNFVFDVELDSIGNAWMGTGLAYTEYGGLAYFNKEDTTVTAYTDFIDSPWFGCYYIHDIEIDRLGRIWMLQEGSSGGVYFESDSFYHASNYVSHGLAYKQYQDPKGGMWIGCDGGFQYSDSSYSSWSIIDSFSTDQGKVSTALGRSIMRLNDTTMVFGSGNGTFMFNTNNGNAQRIVIVDSTWNDNIVVYNMLFNACGRNWFGDNDGFLFVYSISDSTWEIFSDLIPPNPFPDIHVYDIVQDKKGVVYIATVSMGLITYSETEGYKQINIYNDSLPSDVVYDIEVDEFNNKWLGTGWGLVIYNEDGIRFKVEPVDSVFDFYFNVFPNPISAESRVEFGLPQATHCRLSVINTLGQEVLLLKNESLPAGNYSIPLNEYFLQSGIYYLFLQTDFIKRILIFSRT